MGILNIIRSKALHSPVIVSGLVLNIFLLSAVSCSKEKDTVPPVITLDGLAIVHVNLGTSYIEPGYTATDDVDGDITDLVEVTGQVDPQTEGDYFLYYNVKDAAGNAATEKERKVKVMIF